jgi:hypothetical protein
MKRAWCHTAARWQGGRLLFKTARYAAELVKNLSRGLGLRLGKHPSN